MSDTHCNTLVSAAGLARTTGIVAGANAMIGRITVFTCLLALAAVAGYWLAPVSVEVVAILAGREEPAARVDGSIVGEARVTSARKGSRLVTSLFDPATRKGDRLASTNPAGRANAGKQNLLSYLPPPDEPYLTFPNQQPPARPGDGVRPLTRLVALNNAPFPFYGRSGRRGRPFFNVSRGGRKAHRTGSGRIYWASKTYSDNRALVHVPAGFDIDSPAVMVVFYHGHGATLERDVLTRQRLPEQVTKSGLNAVLVAPQFAVDARDSSAGKLSQPGGLRRFLDETAGKLARLIGKPESARTFATMPVVIIAYSGGFVPAAWSVSNGGIGKRLRGVVLLDALYGRQNRFANWIRKSGNGFFVSAYGRSTTRGNARMKQLLAKAGIAFSSHLPARLDRRSVTFISAPVRHRSFVTRAWTDDPVSDILRRLSGLAARRPQLLSSL